MNVFNDIAKSGVEGKTPIQPKSPGKLCTFGNISGYRWAFLAIQAKASNTPKKTIKDHFNFQDDTLPLQSLISG